MGKNTIVVSYGDMLFKKTHFHEEERDYRRLVANLILKAAQHIGYDAVNVGEYDLSLGVGFLKRWSERAQLPFISANLVGKNGNRVFKPYKIISAGPYKIGIIGIMKGTAHLSRVPDGSSYRMIDPKRALEEEVKVLEARGIRYMILLTDMTEAGCERIAHLHLPISVIIGSSRRNHLSLPSVSSQRLILHLDRYGKHIGKLDLYCLKKGGPPKGVESALFGGLAFKNRVIALRKNMPRDQDVAAVMDSTLERIRILKEQMALSQGGSETGQGRETLLEKPKRFVGAEACRACHPKEYEHWKETAHSYAYRSLVKKGSQYDEDCIGCHSIGFRQKGGFQAISKNMMPFVNVQCEACHGPGEGHVERGGNPNLIHKTVPRSVCRRCHTEERSPDFIYRVYLRRLSCGKSRPFKADLTPTLSPSAYKQP